MVFPQHWRPACNRMDKLQRYQFRLLKKLLVRCSTMSTWSKCSSMQVMWKQKRWLTKTKQQWFNAFREADAITSNISLAILSARDQFWDTVLFSFHQHRICEFWDSWNLDTFFMVLPTWALICDTTTSTVFSFPSLKKPWTIILVRFDASSASFLDSRALLADLSQRSCDAVSFISLMWAIIFLAPVLVMLICPERFCSFLVQLPS